MAKFYKGVNGAVVCKLDDREGIPHLNDEEMLELIPNTVEAANEKHIPLAKEENGKVYGHTLVADLFFEDMKISCRYATKAAENLS